MEYTFQEEDKGEYCKITISGKLKSETALTIIKELFNILLKTPHQYILINHADLEGRLSILYSIDAAKSIPAELKNKMLKIAVIENSQYTDNASYSETAFVNRGSWLKFFFSEDEALNWLMH